MSLVNNIDAQLANSYTHYYRDVLGLRDWQRFLAHRLTGEEARNNIRRLEDVTGGLAGKAVLDIGSGWGDVVLTLAEHSPAAAICGIEPDDERLHLARRRLGPHQVTLCCAVGEHIPLPAASVDIVCAYQVLEHVQSRPQVIAEVMRVLKPGGQFHTMMPNYATCFEAHYKIAWLPFLPHSLQALYLRLRGRSPGFLPYFSPTYPWQMRRLLAAQGAQVRDLTHEKLMQRLRQPRRRRSALLGRLPFAAALVTLYRVFFVTRLEYLVAKAPS